MRGVVVSLLVAVAGVWWAPSAGAHDEVTGTSPANGAEVRSAPREVRIDFAADAAPTSGTATITGPEGGSLDASAPRVTGRSLVIPMRSSTAAGDYTVRFRTVSSDGHPVSGNLTFTVLAPPTPATTVSRAPAETAGPVARTPGSATDSDGPLWPWLAGAAAVALATIALLRRITRRSSD